MEQPVLIFYINVGPPVAFYVLKYTYMKLKIINLNCTV